MSSPPPRTRRLFSCLGCLVAGPLGCLAFLGGAGAVGVFFLPEVVEEVVRDKLPEAFSSGFQGELSLEGIDLAWTGPQSLDGVVLRDPEGRTVFRGSLQLPPTLALLGEGDLGRTTLRLEGDVIVGSDGVSNVARALTTHDGSRARFETGASADLEELLRLLFERRGSVAVEISRLHWSAGSGDDERGLMARDVVAVLELGDGGSLHLDVSGEIAGSSPAVNGTERAAGTLRLVAELDREAFFAPADGGQPGVRGSLIAEGLPIELLELLSELEPGLRTALDSSFDARARLGPADGDRAGFEVVFESKGLSASASGGVTSKGLLALTPRYGEAERLDLDARVVGLPAGAVVGYLEPALQRELDLEAPRLDWDAERAVTLSVSALDCVRRGSGSAAGELSVRLPDSTWSFGDGRSLELFGPSLAFRRTAKERWSAQVEASLDEDGVSEARVEYVPDAASEKGAPLPVTGRFAAFGSKLPVARLDDGLALGGRLTSTLGRKADLRVDYRAGEENGGAFSVVLGSDRASAKLEGSLLSTPTEREDWISALDFTGSLDGIGSELFRSLMPEGTRFDWSGPVEVAYEGWRPREDSDGDAVDDGTLPAPGPVGLERPERLLGGSVTVTLPRLVYRDLDPESRGFRLAMTDVGLSAFGDSDVLRVDFFAGVEGGGKLEKHWTFYGLEGPFGQDGHRDLRLRAKATSLPTAHLDQRLRTRGAIADVFGEEVDVEFSGSGLSATGGRISGELHSPRAHAKVEGFQQAGRVLTDCGLELSFVLDERSSARLVHPLLPLVARAEAVGGESAPASLVLRKGILPLDGDARQLAGEVRLELGRAALTFDDRFESYLVAPEDPDPTPVASDLAPLVVMLSRGRVEYTDVTLPVHGHATRVVGDHGLGGTDLDLQVELPIEIVGENVNLLLHNVRDRFQPDFGVPIVISGATMEDLDLSVRPQWIRTVNDVLGQLIPDTLKDTVREILTEDEASSQDR